MSVNLDSYKRSNYSTTPRYNYKEERFYDVLNNPKNISSGRNEDRYFVDMQHSSIDRPMGTDVGVLRRTLQHSQLIHGEVAGKVGAVDQRDYSIRRPLLKIGGRETVDTYSPF